MKLQAEWTEDCGGKWDYDGPIVSISTRYWRDHTAHCALHLNFSDDKLDNNYIELDDHYFEGSSKDDTQHQVEAWAQEQMDKVITILRQHFDFDRTSNWP